MVITQYQARQRFLVIPLSLQNAIFSVQNAEIIASVAADNNLNDEQSLKLPEVIGWLLLGFIHLDDLTKELQDDLLIPQQTASTITSSLINKIFNLIKVDLDKTYAPVPPEEEPIDANAPSPKIIQEIRPATSSSVPPPTLKPTSTPASLSSISAQTNPSVIEQEPIKLDSNKTTSLDEFARVGTKTANPSPATAPTPKPVMLQTASASRPILNAPDFKMPTIAEDIMGKSEKGGFSTAASAVIEFGDMPTPKSATTPQSSAFPKVTAVRYGSEKSIPPVKPLPIVPPTPEPMRTITEITPEVLKAIPTPNTPLPAPFAPLSQIPVPSPFAPKPAVAKMTTPLAPPKPFIAPPSIMPSAPSKFPPSPIPIPKPIGQSEKMVQKDYTEPEK